jgi:hypothetical protein
MRSDEKLLDLVLKLYGAPGLLLDLFIPVNLEVPFLLRRRTGGRAREWELRQIARFPPDPPTRKATAR